MKFKDRQYILQHSRTKTPSQIAADLGIKEKKVVEFLKEKVSGAAPARAPMPHARLLTGAALAMIVAAALWIRIYPVVHSPETERNGIGPFGDTHLYLNLAYNLYKGHGYSGDVDGGSYGRPVTPGMSYAPNGTRGPVYPFFISEVYRTFGNPEDMLLPDTWRRNWDKIRLAQCVLDSLVCVLVFFIVRGIYPDSVWPALIGALVYSASVYNIFYTRMLLSESVTTFLMTAALFLLVLGLSGGGRAAWALAGVFQGLLILSRSEYLPFPFFALIIFFFMRKRIAGVLPKALIFAACALLTVMPWTVRNYGAFKKPIPVSVGGAGGNLYYGTFFNKKTWAGWGVVPDFVFIDDFERNKGKDLFDDYFDSMNAGDVDRIITLDKEMARLAFYRLRKRPLETVANWVTKIPRLWYQNYIPMYFYREASGWFFAAYFTFAVFGAWKAAAEERLRMLPVGLMFLYLNLLYLPLYVEPRYGVALMPGLISLAAIGLWKAAALVRKP